MEYNTGNLEKYTTKNPLKRLMVKRLNDKIIANVGRDLSSIDSEISILDAGCGEGFIDALLIDNYSSIRITGLEFAEEAIEIARKMNPKAEYVQSDITKMPFDDQSFDIVICTEVLEHLEKPDKAISEIIRVAKKYVLLTVPHEPWFCLGNLLVLKNVSRLGNPLDHINHWNLNSFRSFLQKHINRRWRISRSFPWIIAELWLSEGQEKERQ